MGCHCSKAAIQGANVGDAPIKTKDVGEIPPLPPGPLNDLPTTKEGARLDYDLSAVLGKGSFGNVYLGIHRKTHEKVAIKVMRRSKIKPTSIHREFTVLERTGSHRGVVAYKGTYKTPTEVHFVLEIMEGGELFDKLIKEGAYSEPHARAMFAQVAHAMAYLHKRGIIHRDLKPENLLLKDKSPTSAVKIADFGLSQLINPRERLLKICGTWAYAAPEMSDPAKPGYDCRFDTWSFGVILFVVLSGYHPFDPIGGLPVHEIKSRARAAKYDFDQPEWDNISDLAKDLIRRLIVKDPSKRMKSTEILQHPWIRDAPTLKVIRYTADGEPVMGAIGKGSDVDTSGGSQSTELTSRTYASSTHFQLGASTPGLASSGQSSTRSRAFHCTRAHSYTGSYHKSQHGTSVVSSVSLHSPLPESTPICSASPLEEGISPYVAPAALTIADRDRGALRGEDLQHPPSHDHINNRTYSRNGLNDNAPQTPGAVYLLSPHSPYSNAPRSQPLDSNQTITVASRRHNQKFMTRADTRTRQALEKGHCHSIEDHTPIAQADQVLSEECDPSDYAHRYQPATHGASPDHTSPSLRKRSSPIASKQQNSPKVDESASPSPDPRHLTGLQKCQSTNSPNSSKQSHPITPKRKNSASTVIHVQHPTRKGDKRCALRHHTRSHKEALGQISSDGSSRRILVPETRNESGSVVCDPRMHTSGSYRTIQIQPHLVVKRSNTHGELQMSPSRRGRGKYNDKLLYQRAVDTTWPPMQRDNVYNDDDLDALNGEYVHEQLPIRDVYRDFDHDAGHTPHPNQVSAHLPGLCTGSTENISPPLHGG